ncbi:MAG: response regulator transcription factor [Planctomycetes bacterium]|nr:response regulator transcription factor [Planctomycetota bacterium]
MARQCILVVEDDRAIRRGIADLLCISGYDVLEAADGREGLRLALEAHIDLALLDVLLPGLDGFDVLAQVRAQRPGLPVIMVTARGAELDRVRGLQGGADDYVVKPFSPKELLARVAAVLRRSYERAGVVRTLSRDGTTILLERREVVLPGGETRALGEKDARFLAYLAESRGRAVSRGELLLRVWGLDPRGIHTRTVDMLVKRLRAKLDDPQDEGRFIRTVRAKGYMLCADVRVGEE